MVEEGVEIERLIFDFGLLLLKAEAETVVETGVLPWEMETVTLVRFRTSEGLAGPLESKSQSMESRAGCRGPAPSLRECL